MKRIPKEWMEPDGRLGPKGVRWVERRPGTVLLESTRLDREDTESLLFVGPVSTVTANRIADVEVALRKLDSAVADGFWAAGFVSYEAGYAFEQKALGSPPKLPDPPLVWFGIYDRAFKLPRRIAGKTKTSVTHSRTRFSGSIVPSMSEAEYEKSVQKIRQYIEDGDTYQVNYTFRLRFDSLLPASVLYSRLRDLQRVPYAAYINTGNQVILSFSPELFFRREGSRILMRPMKGTAPRGRNSEEDKTRRTWLLESEKNKAENLMIVDLLRNDLGKLARPGSVRVKRFFDIEQYETVFQATSTIEAGLRDGTSVVDLFRALFPSGSVTGAPKIRTMQIIQELETAPRGVYTGAIGFVAPENKAVFNVAIRTVVVDFGKGTAEFGVGSGIVHDSRSAEEYRECLLKARFLSEDPRDFHLLETIRWDPSRGWFLLPLHLRRLASSARYFDFPFSRQKALRYLRELERSLRRNRKPVRIRLQLAQNGDLQSDVRTFRPEKLPVKIGFAADRTNSSDRFLFHKTSRRSLYNAAIRTAARHGLFDLIFRNEAGEITEGARSTLVLREGGRLITPALTCGLLPGTFRESLLRKKESIEERIISPDDMRAADEVFVCNALQGLLKAVLVDKEFTIEG